MSLTTQHFDLEKFKQVLDLMPIPASLNLKPSAADPNDVDQIVYINPAFTVCLGYSVEDILSGKQWFETVFPDPEYREFITQKWRKDLEKVSQGELNLLRFTAKLVCKDQSEKWFQLTARFDAVPHSDYLLMMFVEVDQPEEIVVALQHLSEELMHNNIELELSRSALVEIQEIAQIGSWEVDLANQNRLQWSKQVFELFLENPQTFQPSLEDFLSRLSAEDTERTQQKIEQAISSGEQQKLVVEAKRSDGTPMILELRGRAIYSESGEPKVLVGTIFDVTQRVTLQKENEELAKLIRVTQQEIYVVDYETNRYVYANESASRHTGYSNEELLTFTVYDLNPLLTPEMVQQLKLKGAALDKMHNVSLHQRKDGTTYPVHATLQRVTYNNRPCYAIFDIDISELKKAEQALDEQLKLLQNIVNHVPARIFWKNIDGEYLGANQLFLEDAQLDSEAELIGKTDKEMPWAETDAADYRSDDVQVMQSGQPKLHFEEEQTNDQGETIILSTSKVPLYNATGEVFGVLGTYEDITQRRQMEQELMHNQAVLQHQAHHDALTNLPNRILLQDRLLQAMKHAKRHGKSLALLFIDLDQFKQVNDAMGHEVGDKILQKIASRLAHTIRESDTLARLGGDEFTIIMEEAANPQDVMQLAQKVIDVTKEPLTVSDQEVYLSSSIGISLYPKDSTLVDELLKYADAAMYRAKELGRNNFQFYTEDMTKSAFEQVAMQASLRQAIKNNEFVIAYQPQVEVIQQKITGVEALVRWNHPAMGMVQPGQFIPIAESCGLIVELDRAVMKAAMQQQYQWREQGLNLGILSMNLSVKQIQRSDFIAFLKEVLTETQCQPEWLCLEVTESDVMTNLQAMGEMLARIRALGIRIAIDDFGTGYSSLAYLKRLPVSKLKIDRSFIQDLPDDDEDAIITRTIIMMAKSLGLDVIAEGVETVAQKDFLLINGCNDIQGYFYAKPMFAEQIQDWAKDFHSKRG